MFLLPVLLGLAGLVYQYKKTGNDFVVIFLLFFCTGFAIVVYLNQPGFQPRERDYAYVGSFYAFAIWIGLGVLQVTAWLTKKLNGSIATSLASLVCLLAVPVLMAQQEWDDHDRSKKVLAKDLAKDYLESCAPNAILFSFGDNDTYPFGTRRKWREFGLMYV
jgi:peptidoglycan/LPS O-acetylase OafA/YrhL